jgi:hypothetical protein
MRRRKNRLIYLKLLKLKVRVLTLAVTSIRRETLDKLALKAVKPMKPLMSQTFYLKLSHSRTLS